MRKIIILAIGCFLTLSCFSQSIHGLSFTDIDGGTVSLSNYAGKKIVVIIAPLNSSDSTHLDEIKAFQFRYGVDSIKIIGIMSIEDGYSNSNNAAIKNLYQSKGIDILLTSGMHTKKTSGTSQSSLMQWLTEKDINNRSDIDAQGIMHKFFIHKSGKLSDVIPPGIPLSGTRVGWIIFKN